MCFLDIFLFFISTSPRTVVTYLLTCIEAALKTKSGTARNGRTGTRPLHFGEGAGSRL